MINRGGRGASYAGARGEILGPSADAQMRKALHQYVPIDQERKLRERRRSDTVVVLTLNDTDQGSRTVPWLTPSEPCGKPRVFGFWGEYGRKAET